jgi:hypothetical protein
MHTYITSIYACMHVHAYEVLEGMYHRALNHGMDMSVFMYVCIYVYMYINMCICLCVCYRLTIIHACGTSMCTHLCVYEMRLCFECMNECM